MAGPSGRGARVQLPRCHRALAHSGRVRSPSPRKSPKSNCARRVSKYWEIDEIRPAFIHLGSAVLRIPGMPVPSPYSVDAKGGTRCQPACSPHTNQAEHYGAKSDGAAAYRGECGGGDKWVSHIRDKWTIATGAALAPIGVANLRGHRIRFFAPGCGGLPRFDSHLRQEWAITCQ
ncbi:MAG: hypothetical protein JWR37_846 [Mycobacterium sp.]|nr:hypothetical protein [Mycobacterium sp.]